MRPPGYATDVAEGYTVAEAAELLGIPQRRVLQLIERGVLHGGLDERRRWRVHLVAPSGVVSPPDAAPGDGPAADEHATRNGERSTNAAEAEHAVSDESRGYFRELLAELRHLQERYGQALLALGEARGETAALRERLGNLESYREVRLGPEAPQPSRPAAQPVRTPSETPQQHAPAAVRAEPDPPAEPTDRENDPPRPEPAPRSGRFGGSSVSEAMARAKDPAAFELPGGREAAAALAALQHDPGQPAPEPAVTRETVPVITRTEPAAPVARAEPTPVARAAPATPVARAAPPTPVARAEPSPGASAGRQAIEIHDRDDLRSAVGLRRAPGSEVSPSPDLRTLDRPLDRLRRWFAG